MTTALMQELTTYQRNLPKLLDSHEGEFVVIKGDQMTHFSPSYEAALTWAYDAYGLDRFFVKQVAPDAAVVHLTRDIGPCR